MNAAAPLVAITGASGFIGRALTEKLGSRAHPLSRAKKPFSYDDPHFYEGCGAVVHLAARVHVLKDDAIDPRAAFYESNVLLTLAVARAAHKAGVKQFIFVSSIGAQEFEAALLCDPSRGEALANAMPYQWSKLIAERELDALRRDGHLDGMEIVCLRPPLVYGADAPGNFGRLIWALRRGLPLPFACVNAPRVYVGLTNLTGAVMALLASGRGSATPVAVTDGDSLGVADLIRLAAEAMHRPPRLVAMPSFLVGMMMRGLGMGRLWRSLSTPLLADNAALTALCGWRPAFSSREGLLRTLRGETA